MKNKLALITLFIGYSVFAQITKLSDLSSNKYLDSRIIYDDNKTDVWGYFLLYEKDRKDKNVYELEYVLLDKNLNKIASQEFLQSRMNFLFLLKPALTYIVKKGDAIYFSIFDIMTGDEAFYQELGTPWVRKIDLKSYAVSEQFFLNDKVKTSQPDAKYKSSDYKNINMLKPIGDEGFIVIKNELTGNDRMLADYPGEQEIAYNGFYFYDLDLNQKWYYSFNQVKKDKFFDRYEFVKIDGNDLLLKKKHDAKGLDNYVISYIVIDKNTGKQKCEFKLDETDKLHDVRQINFDENGIVFYTSFQKTNKKSISYYEKEEGYCKTIFNRETGQQVSKDYFKWEAIKDKLAIDQFGEIKDYGYLHLIDFKQLSNGNTIVYAEGFKPKKDTKILDAFVFEFDSKMNVLQFKKFEKIKNDVSAYAWGEDLEKAGGFDYIYSQKLGKDNFSFLYTDNEKTGFTAKKKPQWVLGIVTYVDGQFDVQKITLTTKKGKIIPIKAKNGYVLLQELSNDEKDSEIRLEKINY